MDRSLLNLNRLGLSLDGASAGLVVLDGVFRLKSVFVEGHPVDLAPLETRSRVEIGFQLIDR